MAANEKKFVVTGKQSLRISNVLAELYRQLFLQRSCKLDPDSVITTLQNIAEGKVVPFAGSLRGRFIRTMSIQIGGVPNLELLEQVKAVCGVVLVAEAMIVHADTTLKESETALLIELTPADFGFVEEDKDIPMFELFNEERLAKWSATNLEGYVIELNPVEVGLHLALQYVHKQEDEYIWIATKPHIMSVVEGCDDELRGLTFDYDKDRDRCWLDALNLSRNHVRPQDKILYRLRKVA